MNPYFSGHGLLELFFYLSDRWRKKLILKDKRDCTDKQKYDYYCQVNKGQRLFFNSISKTIANQHVHIGWSAAYSIETRIRNMCKDNDNNNHFLIVK